MLRLPALLTLGVIAASCAARQAPPIPSAATPVLWRAPGEVREPARTPRAPYRFLEEDFDGDSPKFKVVDGNDAVWRVKLGPEARTEVAAGALLSAAGYFVDEMHFIGRTRVAGIDALKRGREYLDSGSYVRDAQFEARSDETIRGATWDWSRNPFSGTEPLDGLRVLMVLINNYDARTANNRVIEVGAPGAALEARYVVTDLGASFGQYGGLGGTRTKGDLAGYRASRFIDEVRDGQVSFAYRTRPEGLALTLFVLNPFYTMGELKKQRDLDRVPLSGIRWIARRLQQMPAGAIRSAFDAAGYSAADAAGFADAVQDRIRQLTRL